ncbi:hypothetical protein RchiOBHm_Chr6g0268181 [Rosa chinensis]|uniref:Uncharacterized protein n=1 Tax=Rosa chinensis TaxID=74649 RepID=A0A2P6PQ54_ROSCH|nr:hypothetical protein RchiOBHm_Chr6g0268181 [Rosa chinensis]
MWRHVMARETELDTSCSIKIKSITDSENCQCRSVNFNGVSKIAQRIMIFIWLESHGCLVSRTFYSSSISIF